MAVEYTDVAVMILAVTGFVFGLAGLVMACRVFAIVRPMTWDVKNLKAAAGAPMRVTGRESVHQEAWDGRWILQAHEDDRHASDATGYPV